MTRKYNIAILGATGAVGETLLNILHERKFPVGQIFPLASTRSAGQTVTFGNKSLLVQDVAEFDFTQAEFGLFSAGAKVSAQYAPIATETGCIVIDNTSQFRYESDIPLVVPEVNSDALLNYRERNIIANPNCSTIQLVVALKPIYDAVGIERINVATYQAVSGSGRKGINELATQTTELLNGRPAEAKIYSQQIAFNVLPHCDDFQDNGYTREEMKIVWETQKILEDDSILVNPTAVRVPVFYGHSEAVHIETRNKLTADDARELLKKAPGIIVVDEPINCIYPTAFSDASGHDEVFVGRIREDISHPMGLNLWVVSDNIRKGAALNTVQIAEDMIKRQLL